MMPSAIAISSDCPRRHFLFPANTIRASGTLNPRSRAQAATVVPLANKTAFASCSVLGLSAGTRPDANWHKAPDGTGLYGECMSSMGSSKISSDSLRLLRSCQDSMKIGPPRITRRRQPYAKQSSHSLLGTPQTRTTQTFTAEIAPCGAGLQCVETRKWENLDCP